MKTKQLENKPSQFQGVLIVWMELLSNDILGLHNDAANMAGICMQEATTPEANTQNSFAPHFVIIFS